MTTAKPTLPLVSISGPSPEAVKAIQSTLVSVLNANASSEAKVAALEVLKASMPSANFNNCTFSTGASK